MLLYKLLLYKYSSTSIVLYSIFKFVFSCDYNIPEDNCNSLCPNMSMNFFPLLLPQRGSALTRAYSFP